MEFLSMIAHLLHTFKAHVAFVAHVKTLFMRYLLMMHKFFDLSEPPPTLFTFMLLKHI